MRRLTLILSDLHLPADAVRESFPTTLELPALQSLLRVADSPTRVGDWRAWLARELGAPEFAERPPAHLPAFLAGIEPAGAWLATPVRLEARLDHVRLSDRGLLHLPLDQLVELAQEFSANFGPEQLIAGGNEHSLLLKGGPATDARTIDPARLLDADIGAALPQGEGANELRRLSAEIEMWLPGSRINATRGRAGLRKITALWLWGGGVGRQASPAEAVTRDVQLFGNDFYLVALGLLRSKDFIYRVPAALEGLGEYSDAFVALAPMSGPAGQSLAELDAKWFAPLGTALSKGAVDSLRVVANDKLFEVRSRSGWKFWRRRRTWLESLA
jgi:hypothetical protein